MNVFIRMISNVLSVIKSVVVQLWNYDVAPDISLGKSPLDVSNVSAVVIKAVKTNNYQADTNGVTATVTKVVKTNNYQADANGVAATVTKVTKTNNYQADTNGVNTTVVDCFIEVLS